MLDEQENLPEVFIRGSGLYKCTLNAENAIGTVQSIEHAIRSLDRVLERDREHQQRLEKDLADYQTQSDKPFEHEQKLKELLARQATLNAALDLDKGERRVAEEAAVAAEDERAPSHVGRVMDSRESAVLAR